MISRREGTRGVSRALLLAGALTLPLFGCGGQDSIVSRPELTLYLARVSVDGIRADFVEGSAPASGGGPSVTVPAMNQAITGGSVQVDLSSGAQFQTVAVEVPNVGGYYLVTVPSLRSLSKMVVTLGGILPELTFDYRVAVAGADGVFGPWSTVRVDAIEVAGGDIQVSVVWNTVADVDLHVVGPGGEEIYYGNRSGASGGVLDLDANAACGTVSPLFQENIGWQPNTAPSGSYVIRVDYWDACGAAQTDFVVTLSLRPGVPAIPGTPGPSVRTWTGSFTGEGTQGGAGDGQTIATFTF